MLTDKWDDARCLLFVEKFRWGGTLNVNVKYCTYNILFTVRRQNERKGVRVLWAVFTPSLSFHCLFLVADGPYFYFIFVPLNTVVFTQTVHWLGNGFSCLMSDFSLTNSLATSSLVRCDNIRRIVQPVSSIWIRLPNDNQHAQDP